MSGAATRDRYRALANRIRAIPGERFGLRPYTVSVLLKSYSGTYTGDGAETETETAVTEANGQPPKVRFLTSKEIALGQLPEGSIQIGPITPSFGGGGTLLASLKGDAAMVQNMWLVKLTGPEFPNGAECRVIDVKTDRALHYLLTVVPVTL